MHDGEKLMIEAYLVSLSQPNLCRRFGLILCFILIVARHVRKCKEGEFDLFVYNPAYTPVILRIVIEMPISESLDHGARDDTMNLLPCRENSYGNCQEPHK
jgi:hypothetical protein